VRRQIELANEVAAGLAGSQDAILKTLEGHLDCDVFLRGNVVTLDGDPEAVDAGETVVRELSDLIAEGHEVAPGTIEAVTSALDQHESPAKILDDVVWRHRNIRVAPKTVNQKRYVDSIRSNTVTFGIGPAGTGKTFLAVAMAAAALASREVNRIILTRPAVEAGERLGFLPGDLMAKVDPYLRPLFDALHDMLDAGARRLSPGAQGDLPGPRAGRRLDPVLRRASVAGSHSRRPAPRQVGPRRRDAGHDRSPPGRAPAPLRAAAPPGPGGVPVPRSAARPLRARPAAG